MASRHRSVLTERKYYDVMPNRLAEETSPYLLQHAQNPVHWYPWSSEALERARTEEKPIFLSIGYSACHWCHVMEHESFEDDQIASTLNEHFISIKVDREERPDLDQIYMQAVQMLTGRGGWPMSVFLTPALQPFFGGTYWPARARRGMPGFDQVLAAVLDAWQNRRAQAIEQAQVLTNRINDGIAAATGADIDLATLKQATRQIVGQFDHTHGGFGQAPKFPHSMTVQFLLRMWSRNPQHENDLLDIARRNLDHMAAGGIYDHLAGGFARYSVDERWLVPHFEKMLYDNALLTDAYLDGYLVTSNPKYAQTATEICQYILTYMTDIEGGFHSTEDADSEGEEGKFYVWTPTEIAQILGPELAERFCYVYDVTEQGNFEGKSILNLAKTVEQCALIKGWNAEELQAQLQEARQRLLQTRDQRVRPGKDDKVLASWNGLMIHAMARVGAALDRDTFKDAAVKAGDFILRCMRRDDGRLLHTWRHGTAKLDGYLDDYANVANSFVSLYEATFDPVWMDEAVSLAEMMLQYFRDSDGGGFFYTADDQESLIARTKDLQDSSIPSGNAMAATVLLRLGHLCHRVDFCEAAGATLQLAGNLMRQYPLAVGQMLIAADLQLGPVQQMVIAGTERDIANVADQLRQRFLPRSVFAATTGSDHLQELAQGKKMADDGQPRLFLCEDFTCAEPIDGMSAIIDAIEYGKVSAS